jgi:hypothetical protein
VLTVVDSRTIGSGDAKRYVLTFSDGTFTTKAMVSDPLLQRFMQNEVPQHSLLRLQAWNLTSVPKKQGQPSMILLVSNAEILGIVPPERRTPAQNLLKLEPPGGSVLSTQASQVQPSPERRSVATPMNPQAPVNRGSEHHLQQVPPAAWGAMGMDSETAMQDVGLFEQRSVNNPYSTNAALEAGVPNSQAPRGQAYGLSALSSAPPQENRNAPMSTGLVHNPLQPQHTGINNQTSPTGNVTPPWRASSLGQGISAAPQVANTAPQGRFENPLPHFGFGPRSSAIWGFQRASMLAKGVIEIPSS